MASTNDNSNTEQNPWNTETKAKFQSKSRSEFLDPCQETAARSIQCLRRNDGDRSMCQDYFQYVVSGPSGGIGANPTSDADAAGSSGRAYRDCKKLWIDKRKEEKKKLTIF
ncbi:hypothetical protein QBC34DRAFT_384675 [Podospora aff. communis PSN243]|uniref:Cytochrome c oxidase-assembly factor cox-23, mitochondrial n=1 Tax=Podospora aff. communis PSN243 TaxID=3040156 RepID=A0AAV9GAE6_9PEZI|nr:hypothetical protein QBC34DRAFT_384675 [Podospora aff. communis PSN243]